MVKKKPENVIFNNSIVNLQSTLNVVFFGRPGSGKSTAIRSMGNDLIFTSSSKNKELNKEKTETGIEYSEFQFDAGGTLKLFSTPGQKRYNDMHFKAVLEADIYIVLIDLTSVAPFAEFMHYKKIINVHGNEDAIRVVAFTHFDRREHDISKLSKLIRHKCYGEILTVKMDVRSQQELHFIFDKLISLMLGNKPAHQFYAENNLFFRSIT